MKLSSQQDMVSIVSEKAKLTDNHRNKVLTSRKSAACQITAMALIARKVSAMIAPLPTKQVDSSMRYGG
jgi:hypothetical protein